MTQIAEDMFELSFFGYGTEDLAKMANISQNDAILLQSGSTIVNSHSQEAMTNLIKKLQEKHNIK